jgi:hypothetical protein
MFAAEWGSGQALWSFFWFFIFVIWIMLLFQVFGDIFRSDDLSGWGKGLWSIFVILVPYFGVFVYIIVRGHKMHEHAAQYAQAQDSATRQYIQETVGQTSTADQLATLAELHSAGKLDDAEYQAAKAKVL